MLQRRAYRPPTRAARTTWGCCGSCGSWREKVRSSRCTVVAWLVVWWCWCPCWPLGGCCALHTRPQRPLLCSVLLLPAAGMSPCTPGFAPHPSASLCPLPFTLLSCFPPACARRRPGHPLRRAQPHPGARLPRQRGAVAGLRVVHEAGAAPARGGRYMTPTLPLAPSGSCWVPGQGPAPSPCSGRCSLSALTCRTSSLLPAPAPPCACVAPPTGPPCRTYIPTSQPPSIAYMFWTLAALCSSPPPPPPPPLPLPTFIREPSPPCINMHR